MNLFVLIALVAITNTSSAVFPRISQNVDGVWGQAVQGIRCSIRAERPSVSSKGPFKVSAIIENVSGAAIDLEKISAFTLATSFDVPDFTLKKFWCPVDFKYQKPAEDKILIGGGPSRLVLAKGASIRVTLDLSKYGWAVSTSSSWPCTELERVVPKGQYQMRLDIQLNLDNGGREWVRSNVVDINIETP